MGFFDFFKNKVTTVYRDLSGGYFFEYGQNTSYSDINQNEYALKTVVKKIAETGKLANINLYENGKLVKENYLYYYQSRPNAKQTWTDFLEDFLTRTTLGDVYLYINSVGSFKAHYFLDYANFDDKTKKYLKENENKLILSENLPKEKHIIYYGKEKTPIKLADVNILKNSDNLKAIQKVVCNSEFALDSKNINLHFSKKFFGYQKAGKDDVQLQIQGLSKIEREDLNKKLLSKNPLHISGKSDVAVERVGKDFKNLGLDETLVNDMLLIANYFNVPFELIYDRGKGLSSQGDAKEKAFVQFVSMCLKPKLQRLTDILELNLKTNQEVKADFMHLEMMKYLQNDNKSTTSTN